jgi:uncharacterized YccA/Bax inhibitor family protein
MQIFNQTKSNNPMLDESKFVNQEVLQQAVHGEKMTVAGAVNKTLVLATLMMLTALFSYAMPNPLFLWGGLIVGFILVIITSFRTHWAPVLAPAYALAKGLFVGTITFMYASLYNGIVFHAISLTVGVLFIMLFLYQARIIVVTEKLRSGIIMATMSVLVLYLMTWGLSFFNITVPYVHEGGLIGIGLSLVIVGIAAMNLLLDFDLFERGEAQGAPKHLEWFAAMGLIVTLIWLYIEILRLLSKLRD